MTEKSVAERYSKRTRPSRYVFDPDELAPMGAQVRKVETPKVQRPSSKILEEAGNVGRGLVKVGKIVMPKISGAISKVIDSPGPVINPMTGQVTYRGPKKPPKKKSTRKKTTKKKSGKK